MGRDAVQAVLTESGPGERMLDAFEALSDRCLDDSYRLAAVILRDPIEAQDVVHDAVLLAWRKFGSLRDRSRFDSWFGRIVLNLCRDRLRARRRGQVREVALGARLELQRRDELGLVAHREAIAAVFPRLDPNLQVVVALRFYRDLELEGIAALLGIPLGTVKSRLHKGLRRLRDELERAGWQGEDLQ
ncbi:MAG: sigma-70 family RNA polymerase sigma factor [Candidatus Limnocylindrales bacterium]